MQSSTMEPCKFPAAVVHQSGCVSMLCTCLLVSMFLGISSLMLYLPSILQGPFTNQLNCSCIEMEQIFRGHVAKRPSRRSCCNLKCLAYTLSQYIRAQLCHTHSNAFPLQCNTAYGGSHQRTQHLSQRASLHCKLEIHRQMWADPDLQIVQHCMRHCA
jgi:hypothetical protein